MALILSVFAAGAARAQQAQTSSSPSALPTINVEGANKTTAPTDAYQAPYQPPPADLGPLGTQDIANAPQSVDIVPESLIDNQQAETVNDILRYLPSVEVRDQQGLEVSRPQSRGFMGSIVQNVRLDGLNYIGTSAIAGENLSGIEVLNGLAGALYGPESPSGVFNYLLKHPTDQSFFTYTESYQSQSVLTEQIDAGGRIGPDQKLGYRINIVHGGGESYVDESSVNRTLGSIDLDYRFDNNTDVEAYFGHYATDITGVAGEISYNGNSTNKSNKSTILPQAVDPSQMGIGQPGAGSNLISDTGMVKITHQINQDWRFEAGGLYENANRGVYGITDTMINNSGDYYVSKNFASVPRFTIGSNSAYLNGRVWLYGMENDIALGTNGFINGQYNYNPSLKVFTCGSVTVACGNLYSPTVLSPALSSALVHGPEYEAGKLFEQSIITGDTIHFNHQWALQAVLNTSFIHSSSYAGTGALTSSTGQNGALSPTVSLMYKPNPQLMTYFTWANSTELSDQAPTSSASTPVKNPSVFLAPYHDTMYEAGAKYAFNPNFLVTIDGFRMTRPYATTDPTSEIFGVTGMQRNWGGELFAQGDITPDISAFGGVTYIDARLEGTDNVATNNMLVIGVPHWKSDILIDLHPAYWRGFAVTGAVHYESSRAATNTNNSFADPYATLDIGGRYSTVLFGHRATARFQVVNVTNKFYYSSIADGSSIVGANGGDTAWFGLPRTFEASLQVDF
ncbi:TonB-dependent receptor [Methylovirgula ligni]|uniref:TonB-dependent receptor n=1 Tax=Methylovirgula ligni TaxID=569860 RepID=UPI001AECCC03|nr:TonB-dependent receptor [Methylovirgula ligni]